MKKLYLLIFFASMAFLLAGCPPKETPAPDPPPPPPLAPPTILTAGISPEDATAVQSPSSFTYSTVPEPSTFLKDISPSYPSLLSGFPVPKVGCLDF